jgi:hypothetical protein
VAAPGIPADTTNYTYYDSQWQAIETRTNGTASSDVTSQTVWSAACPGAAALTRPPASTGFRGVEPGGVVGSGPHPLNINAAVLQDSYYNGVLQANQRLYFTQDANWDTTAVIGYNSTTQTWGVVQRYVYSPYGTITILSPDFTTAPTGTAPIVNNLYQGMALDPATGLYYERARGYRTGQAGLRQEPKSRYTAGAVHREISQDPLQYINGANTYQFVMGDSVENVDPTGLAEAYAPNWGAGAGPLIFNYEMLKIRVCPNDLSKAISLARQEIGDFGEFNQGNAFNVEFVMSHLPQVYASFGINSWLQWALNVAAGNNWRAPVALIWHYAPTYLEAVTQNQHPLVGIRRWYVMPYSSGAFLVLTEAYERGRGPINAAALANELPLPPGQTSLKETTEALWDKEPGNVAQSVKQDFGPGVSWGKFLNHWKPLSGLRNLNNNPWINSLPPSEGPGAVPPPPPLSPVFPPGLP